MRVFLDTNVLVSGFATRGLSADVVRLVLADHDLLTSDDILAEIRRVLCDKLGVSADTVKDIERFLRRHHVEPTPEADPPVSVCATPTMNRYGQRPLPRRPTSS